MSHLLDGIQRSLALAQLAGLQAGGQIGGNAHGMNP
jgi:hypothetical protein